jgi:hypothetical protein
MSIFFLWELKPEDDRFCGDKTRHMSRHNSPFCVGQCKIMSGLVEKHCQRTIVRTSETVPGDDLSPLMQRCQCGGGDNFIMTVKE